MTGLVDVYDGAYCGDLSQVPKSVVAIAGYVGGPGAYHVWSPSDSAAVRASDRQFWSIWVPPKRTLKAQDGIDAARGMIPRVPLYTTDKTRPVFMDIEYGQYTDDPQGANLAASTFQATMMQAGYTQAYPYCPFSMARGWVSEYVYSRPTQLPVGTIGWQYENDAYKHKGWDASVFDISLYRTSTVHTWSLDDMKAAVIITRLTNGKYYRLNILDGSARHLLNADAVSQCRSDLDAANIPYTTDSRESLSGYQDVS